MVELGDNKLSNDSHNSGESTAEESANVAYKATDHEIDVLCSLKCNGRFSVQAKVLFADCKRGGVLPLNALRDDSAKVNVLFSMIATESRKDVASNAGSHSLQTQTRKRLHKPTTSIIREPYLTRKSQSARQMAQNQSITCDTRNVQQFSVNVQDLNNTATDNTNVWSQLNNGVSQSPEFSVSLTAIKHDHPLLASGYESVTKNSSAYDEMLIGSLPPPPTTAMNASWQFNDMDKFDHSTPYSLPYGLCYDESFLDQSQQKKSDEFIYPLEDEWSLNNKVFSCDAEYGQQMWSPLDYFDKPIKMEEAFQTDKMDKTGPTLAQLNSDVWDAIDLDELLMSSSGDVRISKRNESLPVNTFHKCVASSVPAQSLSTVEDESKLQDHIDYLSSMLTSSSKDAVNPMLMNIKKEVVDSSPCESLQTKTFPAVTISPPTQQTTVLSTLLNSPSVEKPTVPITVKIEVPETTTAMQTSSNNVVKLSPSLRNRNSSMSTECSVSSHDEGFDSDSEEDSDDESFYGDYDAKDLLGASTSDDASNKWALNMGRSRKGGQQRYFWQYNVQSKGPKGTRISSVEESSADPHVLCEASDPVFSPDCHVEGVKHAGKARRGDGNDLTPNPRKLLMIGLELKKLSKVINDLTPVAEVPVTARNKSRKEKNKLASRACRLKKKAQHEANKIKLYGLQQEHKKLMSALVDIRRMVRRATENEGSFSATFDQIVANKGPSVLVAGKTTEFVNSILDNVASGINNGGLEKV